MATRNRNGVISRREHDRLGIAVELFRVGSGAYVVGGPVPQEWVERVNHVAGFNYGKMTVIMRPSTSDGYDEKYGVVFAFVPGDFSGQIAEKHPAGLSRNSIEHRELSFFGDRSEDFMLETNIDDAIAMRDQLTRVIRDARRLTAKGKKAREPKNKAA